MCVGTPKVSTPAATVTPAVQDVKDPTTATVRTQQKKATGIAGGSLLTGPSGVDVQAANLAGQNANTLLGA